MKLFYRIGYYLFGFTIGLFLLSIIFKGKKTSCNYSPNDRVINDLSKKKWNSILEKKSTFDSISFHDFLRTASVDFSMSDTSMDSCKIYNLNGYWNEQALSLEVENCEKTVKLINLYLINK
tara:strand:+ start:618 stop:980 length:363 start_codon:yes stop_codon:yes gene_type:complete